jgi:hypothetical protein
MNLKLDFDIKKILPQLIKAQPYLVGMVLIAVFGYTAWVVNEALNVKPGEPATVKTAPKITFDRKTIDTVKNLNVVSGQINPGDIGKDDPFGR